MTSQPEPDPENRPDSSIKERVKTALVLEPLPPPGSRIFLIQWLKRIGTSELKIVEGSLESKVPLASENP